jgi:hypothetical protein
MHGDVIAETPSKASPAFDEAVMKPWDLQPALEI